MLFQKACQEIIKNIQGYYGYVRSYYCHCIFCFLIVLHILFVFFFVFVCYFSLLVFFNVFFTVLYVSYLCSRFLFSGYHETYIKCLINKIVFIFLITSQFLLPTQVSFFPSFSFIFLLKIVNFFMLYVHYQIKVTLAMFNAFPL